MMNLRIAKEYHWEMSHRLPFHDGPCRNIHGHSYMMRIELEGKPLNNDMVLDYYDLNKIVEPVIAELDHCFLLDEGDKLLIDFVSTNNFKHKVIPWYSTVENIVRYYLNELMPEFRKFGNIDKLKLRIHETSDTFAESEISLQ